MKEKLPFYLVVVALLSSFNQEVICRNEIQPEDKIKIDGTIEKTEWEDATSIYFEPNEIVKAKVLIKQDSRNLFFAFVYEDVPDSTYIFPEIFIDTEFDKGDKWNANDYWFHVSAQDCYAIGKREDYTKCGVSVEEWSAVPNYPFGNEYKKIEAFEIHIPLELLNIKQGRKIGVCFSIAIFPEDVRINFPSTANENIPNTWWEMTIDWN